MERTAQMQTNVRLATLFLGSVRLSIYWFPYCGAIAIRNEMIPSCPWISGLHDIVVLVLNAVLET